MDPGLLVLAFMLGSLTSVVIVSLLIAEYSYNCSFDDTINFMRRNAKRLLFLFLTPIWLPWIVYGLVSCPWSSIRFVLPPTTTPMESLKLNTVQPNTTETKRVEAETK